MRVRCVTVINEITRQEQTRSDWLSVGTEYVVLSLESGPTEVDFRLVGDDGKVPALYKAQQFVTVNGELPSNWRAHLGEGGRLVIAPALWLRPGFWEDYFNQVPEAMTDFRTEHTALVAEMSPDSRMRLEEMIQGFLNGADRSLTYVHQIEGLLIEEFADTELFEELSPYLAMYRPGGGEQLYNEEQLARELRYVLNRFLIEENVGGSGCMML
jgi:hypothetical protein